MTWCWTRWIYYGVGYCWSCRVDLLRNHRFNGSTPQLADVLSVTSGKGGVGKTSISVNLALLFQQLRKRVLLIDADIHLGNVDLVLGLRPRKTLADVLLGEAEMESILIPGPGGIDILPASSGVAELLDCESQIIRRLNREFQTLQSRYHLILLDTGAGLSKVVLSFIRSSVKTVLVVTPDPASIADAYGMMKVISRHIPRHPILILANMVSTYDEGTSIFQKLNLMASRFLNQSLEYAGSIPRSADWAQAVLKQTPLLLQQEHSMAARALKMVGRNVLRSPGNPDDRLRGFFDGFLEKNLLSEEMIGD
ncbi:MAG: MinD/ParA family protein [Candidatus Neomarinimicrobiota bacterium]|nr:MAG: MinD/ParA family protein [Candidatus Neomarinimicrobiota bacterium]